MSATRNPISVKIKDRIKEFRRVRASEIGANEKNWRVHTPAQRKALNSMLAKVGWAGAVLAYEKDGKLIAIDGHLRAESAGDQIIPVLVTDLTEQEADYVLATFDPLSEMAERDQDALFKLLATLDSDLPPDSALRTSLDIVFPELDNIDLSEYTSAALEQKPNKSSATESGSVDVNDDTPLSDFVEVDPSKIETQYCCPRCKYAWSGKPIPISDGVDDLDDDVDEDYGDDDDDDEPLED